MLEPRTWQELQLLAREEKLGRVTLAEFRKALEFFSLNANDFDLASVINRLS